MANTFSQRLKDFIKNDLWIVILDILAVNLSYLLALYIRFFVNGEFRVSVGYYVDYFWRIAPVYTVLAIAAFALFKLYGGMLRFAGLNDMNRIITANLVTVVLQVAASIAVLAILPDAKANRMPFSYYVIGAVIQFIFVVLIRFSHKILLVERAKIASSKVETIPALVVGSNELGRKIVHHLEDNTVFRAVAIVGKDSGRMMDGVPVINIDAIAKTISEKGIKAVFIAEIDLTKEQRDQIRQAAEDIEINDFTGYMSNQTGFLPLTNLLEVMDMPIHVTVDGEERTFTSAEECLSSLPGEYDITRVQASKLFLKKREEDKSWMQDYRNQTGQDVSFF